MKKTKEELGFEEPSWAKSFQKRYHFRVRFGKKLGDGTYRTSDGRAPMALVQVVSWSKEAAALKAIWTARTLYRDDPVVKHSDAYAEGYAMYDVFVRQKRSTAT